jgi:hypothetical protein
MSDDWASQFTQHALDMVDRFIDEHPEYTRQGVEQPGQGSTNRVVFAHRGRRTVVFKVFCETERKERACFGLCHWREMGLVPELIEDAGPRMIVMSHIPGMYLWQARQAGGDTAWHAACRATGHAVGSLTRVPLRPRDRRAFESRFYAGLGPLEAYLGRILELGRRIQARDPDFKDDFWRDNLDFCEGQLGGVLSQPRVLYHQDTGNLHVQGRRFVGFFDLEMCRVGCWAMQLGSSLDMLEGDEGAWASFRRGWEAATSKPLALCDRRAAAAAHHLLGWREISRYLSYNGTPGTGFAWAAPADPIRYRRAIETAQRLLQVGQ